MSRMAAEQELPERIPSKDHLPLSIVWCPLPVLTWFVPFIGHLGIVTSDGVIHDFVGPYTINKSRSSMGFGHPTKYLPIKLNDIRNAPNGDKIKAWDAAVESASDEFGERMHNLFCNNCHDHVAYALNDLEYGGSHNWGTIGLMLAMIWHGKYVSTSRFLMTNLPFLILAVIIIGVTVGAKLGSS